MKKFLTLIAFAVFSLTTFAQKDVTKFLGIPVDGTKAEMIQKLKEKGFKPSEYDKDVLEGKFNGYDVQLFIGTNGNKVYRIMVSDANSINESSIRIRFNELCRQFNKNDKYSSLEDFTIPDDEDVSYQMSVKSKRYQASFYQRPEKSEEELFNEIIPIVKEKYGELLNSQDEEVKKEIQMYVVDYMFELYAKKTVWFMISEGRYGDYYINMYYDNGYNMADGEDL